MNLCLECDCAISHKVSKYSINKFGISLCIKHQKWIEFMEDKTTDEVITLYFALKERGVPAKIEKYDGHKHIDIAIPEARMNIEVDGTHHNHNKRQALTDLKRTYYSFLKGYFTLRIPNSLVNDNRTINETANLIVGILKESYEKTKSK